MLREVDFYYFSPTGGTKKAGEALAFNIANTVSEFNLAEKMMNNSLSDVVIVAVPVFGGRIPGFAADKIKELNGQGKTAITAVVYGVRAYEDALLELNNIMKNCGFDIIASLALIAQHSVVPTVGAGRPDQKDIEQIKKYAKRILNKIAADNKCDITVPGNYPYKDSMKVPAVPISTSTCSGCGYCSTICPTEAISNIGPNLVTDITKCMMCMSCVVKCPTQSRILPHEVQALMTQKLSVLKDVRRENELYE